MSSSQLFPSRYNDEPQDLTCLRKKKLTATLVYPESALEAIISENVFNGGARDQVMLFERPPGLSKVGGGIGGEGEEEAEAEDSDDELFRDHDDDDDDDDTGATQLPQRQRDRSYRASDLNVDLDMNDEPSSDPTAIPTYIHSLLYHLETTLLPLIPRTVHDLIFTRHLARQVILNLYPPGQGISPHVDLPARYDDGILGVSLLGGCVMEFERVREHGDAVASDVERNSTRGENQSSTSNYDHEGTDRVAVYMPKGTVYVISGEARWEWKHGIPGRKEDKVFRAPEGRERCRDVIESATGAGPVDPTCSTRSAFEHMRGHSSTADAKVDTISRGTRVSVTFRWMRDGGDVLS